MPSLILTNLIVQEEMTLIKYTFLVFCMGQFIRRATDLLLLLSTRKSKESFWQAKRKCLKKNRQDSNGSSCLFSVVNFLP